MQEEDITFEALSGDAQLTPSDVSEAVETVAEQAAPQGDAMTLAEINASLGKNFRDKETALKAFKDTFSYVGKKKEDIEKEVLARVSQDNRTDTLAKELEAIRKDMFYKDNPEYASYRGFIEKVGGNPSEVVNTPEFKEVFTKASGYDESQKLRTVLESNPRIASSKDKLSKAREMQHSQGHSESVEKLAVDAVLEAYEQ